MVAFTIFGKDIYWYGIIIAFGMLAGIYVACRNTRTRGMVPDHIYDLALLVVPLAVIGARIYYVAFQWESYYSHMNFSEVFAIWHGGMALYGGVIGGLLGIMIYARWKKVSPLCLMDIVAPALILGQAIGRWGNFANQEAYGYAVDQITWQFFPVSVFIEATGRWHLATFFYESMWNLGTFVVLMLYLYEKIWKNKPRHKGDTFALYLVLYGLGRVWIEGLRTDSLYWGPFRISQVLSAIFVVAGVAYFIAQRRLAARWPALVYVPAAEAAQQACCCEGETCCCDGEDCCCGGEDCCCDGKACEEKKDDAPQN